jgi:molybdopterin-containing oxidoreductase family iron-sulfur binding subunit
VAIADRQDETASLCKFVAPENHALESWSDHEPEIGLFSLTQPGLRPLYRTRQGIESLLAWCGSPRAGKTSLDLVRTFWETNLLKGESWATVLERGFIDRRAEGTREFNAAAVTNDVGAKASAKTEGKGLEFVPYESVAQGDGRHANNAWLQEVPDPLSMVCWENVVALAPATMATLGVSQGHVLNIEATVKGVRSALLLPAVKQPGLAENTAAIALGYGRTKCGRLAEGNSEKGVIGANAYPLIERGKTTFVTVKATGDKAALAITQTHDSQEGRPHAQEVSLAAFIKSGGKAANSEHSAASMWPGHEYKGHRWGLIVDLHACIGCTGCVVGCQAENNIPVVGKEEVQLRREMSWMRIDRYYSDDKPKDQSAVEDNPKVSFQPLMCQHCENAPCETVCPVLATTHSSEGLNQQTYNRCVGTRYCANNCPFKVRRFNWFNYKHGDPTLNLVLNPDVSVRTRGVMEKCSMCVQRIHDAKIAASKEGRKMQDHEVKTACEQSCPTQAIVFGDLNDKSSDAAKLAASGRNYVLLDELNVKPGVHYLAKVRNATEA